MLDWQISEEEQPLASLPQEERPVRRVRRWYLWGGLLLVLVVAGLLLFRWRLDERTEAMEEDLRAFVRHEEQQRAFGLTEQADELMVSNAPKLWQQGYRSMFVVDADEVQPVEVEVEEIELNGTEAYVTVRFERLDGFDGFDDYQSQVRFYRLVEQEWRRAPLFAAFWGEEKQIELADEQITIVYPAREEAFAQRLAADLPALLQLWPAKTSPSTPVIIKIKPSEFAPVLFYLSGNDETQQIVLNSPSLMMQGFFDGEAGIRLALANALLEEVDLDYDARQSLLPSGVTFLGALRNTFVLRWALPDEAIPRQIWRDKIADLSPGPFLGQSKIYRGKMELERVWEPHPSDAMSLLIADYLYDQHGHETLSAISKQLPSAQSWDRLFYPLTGDYTIEVEQAALWQDSADQAATAVPNLPLPVRVLSVNTQTGQLEVQVAEQEQTLSIETADSTLMDAAKKPLTPECAMLHQELTITTGDWLELGQRVQARELIINDSQPAILPRETALAPPDTLAYLVERRKGSEQAQGFGAFLALSEEGTATDLSTLPPEIRTGWHIQSNIPWPARFLLTVSVPNCEQMWLLMYDPQQGVVGHWLVSSSDSTIFPAFVWRPQENDIILTSLFTNHQQPRKDMSYISAKPGEPLRTLGLAESFRHPLGWLGDQAITIGLEGKTVELINLESGDVTKSIPIVAKNTRYFLLSEDSKQLFYTNESTERPALHVVNFESEREQFLLSAPNNELLAPISARKQRLLLRVGPEVSGRFSPTHFLLLDLSSKQPAIIMKIPHSEFVTNALLCADDRVLMTIYQQGTSEVRMWQPDGSMKSLLKSDRALMLVSCR